DLPERPQTGHGANSVSFLNPQSGQRATSSSIRGLPAHSSPVVESTPSSRCNSSAGWAESSSRGNSNSSESDAVLSRAAGSSTNSGASTSPVRSGGSPAVPSTPHSRASSSGSGTTSYGNCGGGSHAAHRGVSPTPKQPGHSKSSRRFCSPV